MEKIWLKQYPRGRSAPRSTSSQYASVRDMFEESCGKFAARPAFSCMGKTHHLRASSTAVADFGAWLQGAGLREGRARRADDAQHPAVSRGLFGILRAGRTVVNVNPLYTARELEHQLKDSGAESIVVRREFRPHLAGGARARPRCARSS